MEYVGRISFIKNERLKMCDICGIYTRGLTEINRNRIVEMRDVMFSRGPDDAGVYVNKHIGFWRN